MFANKFACGSAVQKVCIINFVIFHQKTEKGSNVIVIQGDVRDDLIDFMEDNWPELNMDNVFFYDEKSKKKSSINDGHD